MSRKTGNSKGMAIIIVLVLSMALLIFGVSYTKNISQVTSVNPDLLLRSQLDILGEGISNIALLKFKELPSDFYYSYYKGRVATPPRDLAPLNTFQNDVLLRGELPNPNDAVHNASFTTTYQVLSQKKYDTDTLEISVTVQIGNMKREVKRTINTTRRRIF
ncbi:MAG: hypothetical protein KKB51_03015 [Candidatus Riflebacteria bacterium]|nr:hypothetical protein [Candidatus Riflebacteria bacterium]